MLPEGRSPINLTQIGIEWLKLHENKNQWGSVWKTIIGSGFRTDQELFELLSLGRSWLIDKETNETWSFVYEKCLQNNINITLDFLLTGVRWIGANSNRSETYGIANEIAKYYLILPPKEKLDLADWLNRWLSSNTQHPSWTYAWKALWMLSPSIESINTGLLWIENQKEGNNKIFWLIMTILETDNIEYTKRIYAWYEKNSKHETASIVLNAFRKAVGRTEENKTMQ
jgi:hypothetical protein